MIIWLHLNEVINSQGIFIMNIITRKEALCLGLKRYYTGKPCKHGHLSERLISYGCITCNKLKNKQRVKLKYATDKSYVKKERLRKRESYKRHSERYRDNKRKWRVDNPVQYFARKTLERLESTYKLDVDKYREILGYTSKDFKDHIESLWLDGMTWG